VGASKTPRLVEGIDFYMEGEAMVFTAHFLLRRGYCCNSGCRHCPYSGDAPEVAIEIVGLRGADDDRD